MQRLSEETGLDAASAVACADLLGRALRFDAARRENCFELRAHPWLLDASNEF